MTHNPLVVFEGTMFPEISVIANPEFVNNGQLKVINDKVESNIAIDCLDLEKRRYLGELRVRTGATGNNNTPYTIDILCITSFRIDPDIPDEALEQVALRAAHSMAFPAVRELILTLTARQPWGQFSIGMSLLRTAPDKPDNGSTLRSKKNRPHTKRATVKT